MHHLTWIDHSRNIIAHAKAHDCIEDQIEHKANRLPVKIWILDGWSYTYRIAPKINSGVFLNAVLPTCILLVDGAPVKGSTLLLPGEWRIREADPSFADGVAFHIEDFFTAQGVMLADLFLSLPSLLEKHMKKIRSLQNHGEEV